MTALDQYISHLDNLVKQLSPTEIHKLHQQIGRKIRQRVKNSIKSNTAPDGTAFTPRHHKIASRPLHPNEQLSSEQPFLYSGKLRRFRTLRTALTSPSKYNPNYLTGWEYSAQQVQTFARAHIGIPSQTQKAKLMFRKIHQYKYLKSKADSHQASIGFLTGLSAYIAAAHQYGEDTRPERQLLGFSDDDLRTIEETLIHHLSLH